MGNFCAPVHRGQTKFPGAAGAQGGRSLLFTVWVGCGVLRRGGGDSGLMRKTPLWCELGTVQLLSIVKMDVGHCCTGT